MTAYCSRRELSQAVWTFTAASRSSSRDTGCPRCRARTLSAARPSRRSHATPTHRRKKRSGEDNEPLFAGREDQLLAPARRFEQDRVDTGGFLTSRCTGASSSALIANSADRPPSTQVPPRSMNACPPMTNTTAGPYRATCSGSVRAMRPRDPAMLMGRNVTRLAPGAMTVTPRACTGSRNSRRHRAGRLVQIPFPLRAELAVHGHRQRTGSTALALDGIEPRRYRNTRSPGRRAWPGPWIRRASGSTARLEG